MYQYSCTQCGESWEAKYEMDAAAKSLVHEMETGHKTEDRGEYYQSPDTAGSETTQDFDLSEALSRI